MIHPAEQAVVRHALERGFLDQARVDGALAQLESQRRAGQRANFLQLLAGPLGAEQREELRGVYQQALAGDATLAPQARAGPAAAPATAPPAAREQATIGPQPVVPARFELPVAPPPLLQGGTRIGPFRVIEELARGGMGVVFVAEHVELGRRVALKTLIAAPGMAATPQVGRFLTEARAAARLRHPNIVAVHDVGVADGRHYLSMDLIAGESLKDRLETLDYLDPHRAAEITRDLAKALGYAHEQDVLHRDLKPANILLRAGDDTPLLTDFGLAKLAEDSRAFTRTGEIMGTPHYMPPEQARGDKPNITARSDVYGLGATLYHMLAGRPPFQGATLHVVLGALLAGELAPPHHVVKSVPRRLSAICMKALERDPQARYASMGALADDLERFLSGRAVAAGRRRAPLLLAVLLLPLLLGLGGWLLRSGTTRDPATTNPPPPVKTSAVAEPPQTPAQPAWAEIEPAGKRPALCSEVELAYDAGRGVCWLFGGRDARRGLGNGTLWRWDGERWLDVPKPPGRAPARRVGHAMAYDPVHRTLVLVSAFRRQADTWVWNGARWRYKRTPALLQRFGHRLVHDGKQLLLFGGNTFDRRPFGDLWAWSGKHTDDWRQIDVRGRRPPPRTNPAMAWDARRGRLLIYGGRAYDAAAKAYKALDDMWAWDGSTWRPVSLGAPTPGPRAMARMVATSRGLLLVGGYPRSEGRFLGDSWLWDGRRWKQLADTRPLSDRWSAEAGLVDFGLAWDSQREVAVLFGGNVKDGATKKYAPVDQLWELALPRRPR